MGLMQVRSKGQVCYLNRRGDDVEGGILSCCSKLGEHLISSLWYWLREGVGRRRWSLPGDQEQVIQLL